MSSYNYLDKTGLGTLWGKIKALIPTNVSSFTNDSGYITSTSVTGLTDTTITTPTDGQVLTYDSTTSKWVNADGGGDAITYTISATNNTITLTGSDSSTSTATFPIYDGTILSTWEGGNF